MQKNTKILLGVLAVLVIGVSAYFMSGGSLSQGRLSLVTRSRVVEETPSQESQEANPFDRSSVVEETPSLESQKANPFKKSYVDYKGFCDSDYDVYSVLASDIPEYYKCPDGLNFKYGEAWQFCKKKKQKDCSMGNPDAADEDAAMCKALEMDFYLGYSLTCVTVDECKQYAEWHKAGTLTKTMKKSRINFNKAVSCDVLQSEIWWKFGFTE